MHVVRHLLPVPLDIAGGVTVFGMDWALFASQRVPTAWSSLPDVAMPLVTVGVPA